MYDYPGAGYGSRMGEVFSILSSLFQLFIFFIVVVLIISFFIRRKWLHNHWSSLIKGLSYSSLEFYEKLAKELEKEEIPGLKLSTRNISQGGILSSKRQYAVITWGEYSYSVCAAPFANSFFVSYRLLGKDSLWANLFAGIPWIGKHLIRVFFTISWYKEDTIDMSQCLIHESILTVVNEIARNNNLPELSERQSTPRMKSLFKRS